MQWEKVKIDPKINSKINPKNVLISNRSVNIRKYCKDFNRNNFGFQYLR